MAQRISALRPIQGQHQCGVLEVRQLDDRRLHWVAEIAGVRRQWDASILEQVPDEKIAWAATEGATNAGAVYFSSAGPSRTAITLALEYEPHGLVESVGDKLDVVEKQAEGDMERYFREGMQATVGGGSSQIMRTIIAQTMKR